MGKKLKNSGLVGLGVVAGIAISLQFSAMAQKPVDPPLPLEELRQLADVFGLIKSDYVEPVEDKKLLTEAISGMVASLDPHSAYLDKKAYAELREGSQGKFVGLGIEIGQSEDGYIKIVAPIEDSPAWRAGIKPGDLISRLDNTPVKGMSLDDSIKKMRGEPNSKVSLTVLRKGEAEPLVFNITREEIHQKSVKGKLVEPGYAWVRISQFQEPTVDDMAAKILELYKQDPNIKGLVLDLRNDPGGVLQGAIGVAAAFLPKDSPIVSTNGQLPDQKQIFYGRPEYYALRNDSDALAKLPPPPSSGADGGAGQHRFGLGLGNRRRRAAGLQAGRNHRHADLRQGLGANHPPADRRHRRQADHGALLHAERPLDPGQGHHAGRAGG
jgi:carboxyl-terminal processing protease